jgi:hypothetical protein
MSWLKKKKEEPEIVLTDTFKEDVQIVNKIDKIIDSSTDETAKILARGIKRLCEPCSYSVFFRGCGACPLKESIEQIIKEKSK